MKRLLLLAFFALPLFGAWPNGYTYRRKITIDHTKVGSSDATNFSVLLCFNGATSTACDGANSNTSWTNLKTVGNGGHVQNTVSSTTPFTHTICADCIITDSDGSTVLPFAVVSYSATTGETYIWVKKTVSHTNDTVLYAYVGNSTVTTDQSSPTSAWDSFTKAMWPLSDGTTLQGQDWTTNALALTNHSATATTGQIDGGVAIASSQFLEQTSTTALQFDRSNSFSVSGWINTASTSQGSLIGNLDTSNNFRGWELNYDGTASKHLINLFLINSFPSNAIQVYDCLSSCSFSLSAWHHFVVSYDGSSTGAGVKWYIDGVATTTDILIDALSATTLNSDTTRVGIRQDASNPFTGSLDQLRVSSAVRGADWATADFNNTNSPNTFYVLGAESTYTATSIISPACSANSPNSVLCVWDTNNIANSQVTCTGTGGPYSTTTLNPVNLDSGWGVIHHSVAVTGMPTNTSGTAYSCTVTSSDGITSANTGSLTSGTTAALATTPLTVAVYSPPTYYNDQANGLHGFTANGRKIDGDTKICTWADDGKEYCSGGDSVGVGFCCSNAVDETMWNGDFLNWTQLGNTSGSNSTGSDGMGTNKPTTYPSDGNRNFNNDTISVRGAQYVWLTRCSSTCGPSSNFVTRDHFATTIGPQDNIGPASTGTSFTSGVWDYPTSSGQMTTSLGFALFWMEICQDWGGSPPIVGTGTYQFSCPWNSGADGWLYGIGVLNSSLANFVIVRVRIEDIQMTSSAAGLARYQVYTGTGSGSDGLLDANWVAWDNVSGTLFAASKFGDRPKEAFVGAPFNRWVLVSESLNNASQNGSGMGISVWDVGPYPWAWNDAALVANIPKDTRTYINYLPSFPQLYLSTYSVSSSEASITLHTVGSFIGPQYGNGFTNPNDDRYSITPRQLILAPRVATPYATRLGQGRGQIPQAGLDLYYDFREVTNGPTIHNHAPTWSKFDTGGLTAASYSEQGANMFGFPTISTYSSPSTYTATTPYTTGLNDFVLGFCFEHDGNFGPASTESPLDKADIRIARNSTTANSWNFTVGSTVLGPYSVTTDGTFACVLIRRIGTAVSVYKSDGVGGSMPLTALGTGTASGTLGTSHLTLGSLIAGSQPFYGTIGELVVYNGTVQDAGLIPIMAGLRADMAARGVTIP